MNHEAHYMNYSENCLIALTEAPTQNIKSWSARKYEQNGLNVSVLKMISTGYHDPEVWKSVIFQLQQALYILNKKGICIWNFNLENNVYIKDTNYDNNNIGYWKYKINGIEFYVPNYGSIVLIDTNFKDLNMLGTKVDEIVDQSNQNKLEKKSFRHKIMMKEYFDDKELTNEIDVQNNDIFNNVFSEKEFDSTTDKIYGGIAPDTKIKELISKIKDLGNNLESLIKSHGYYLHNRVGTLLTEAEKKNVVLNQNNFKPGELVAYTEDGLNYEYAIFYNKETNTSSVVRDIYKIIKIDRIDNKINTEIKIVDLATINMVNEKVKQKYTPNMKLADEDLIETYEINF